MAKPRIYLDTSVFIAAVKGETDRVLIARHLLEDGIEGKIDVFASTYLAAEFIYNKNEGAQLKEDEENGVKEYLNREFITWVELDLLVAEHARELARAHSLKPADAVHLASAIRVEAQELMRWDNGFHLGEYEGVAVCDPHWEGQPRLSDDFDRAQ